MSQKVVSNEVKKPKYDQIWQTQQAINMAISEERVVRFKTGKSNKEIKREITDLRGCLLRKPDKHSDEVAVIPPWINDFCFEEKVDESLIVIPKPRIYKP
jgi:hypothetical protein